MQEMLFGLVFGLIAVIVFMLCRLHSLKGENVELRQHAFTDDLTGLKNQRYYNEFFLKEVNFARRYNLPVSIILIDLNNFKTVNDKYGHAKGDDYLKEVARILRRTAKRAEDHVIRYGGDEFVIILPGAEPKDAERIAQRIKTGVTSINQQLGLQIETSASAGVAGRTIWRYDKRITSESEAESLFNEADALMYKQKEAARKERLESGTENQG